MTPPIEYIADDDDPCFPMPMVAGMLLFDPENIEGEIGFYTAFSGFNELSPLAKADIAKDWFGLAERFYHKQLEEWQESMEKARREK